jgi:chemotaxis methyl-accepting protein methylase
MAVMNAPTVADYIVKLKAVPAEITLLFRDLLIRVTGFFRDRETFDALASKVIPQLFEGKMADGMVRVWVPGCATGEEAYSLAILLREHMDTLPATPKVQVFATDIDDSGIATARLGRYPKTLLEGLSEERRRRFFSISHGSYCVTKEIRDLCTFSVHNLVRDPPFSMMNLVSCRNLLIYMNPELQARIIPVFHYSLVPGGMLLLGGSESVAGGPYRGSRCTTADRTRGRWRAQPGTFGTTGRAGRSLDALHYENPAVSRARQHGERRVGHVHRYDQHSARRDGIGRSRRTQGCVSGHLVARTAKSPRPDPHPHNCCNHPNYRRSNSATRKPSLPGKSLT